MLGRRDLLGGAALALLLVSVAPARAAEGVFPETAAGRAARDYLEVFNRGDPKAFADFVQKRAPALSSPPDWYWFTRDQSGGFDVVRLNPGSDTRLNGLLKARSNDTYLEFTLQVDAGAAGLIRSATLRPIPRPPDIPAPARMSDAALLRTVEARLEATPDYSGVVLIAREGRTMFTAARGFAGRERQIPNTVETQFRIASMGKMFTAVAVVQLAQSGKLHLDATVGDYLKDYPNQPFARTVTIQQLLTHTAGAGDFMGPQYLAHRAELKTPQDYIALFGARPPDFPPGSRWSYANFGFVVLERIVEVVSGERYPDFVREHIFAPAGMTRSGVSDPPPGGIAEGYIKAADGVVPAPHVAPENVYATAPDLLAFANALVQHRLLDAEHTTLLTTGKVSTERDAKYAYGFFDYSTEGLRDFGHDGGMPGFNGDLRILGDGRVVVVTLGNVGPPPRPMQLSAFIAARATP